MNFNNTQEIYSLLTPTIVEDEDKHVKGLD